MTKTYAQLTREIQALQASAEKLRAAEVKSVIAKLNESIAAYGLTADDLQFAGSASGGRRPASAAASSSRSDASRDAKYSDGNGHVWGGRGPRPAWLRNAIANGKSLESFETSHGAPGGDARSTRNNGGHSTASKVKLPPLYGHPKTGQTWSGRGPKPEWLKQGLKKRGASIDDFLISARTPAPAEAATPAPASEPSRSPGARAKPAAAAPAPAAKKKSLSEKIASRSKSSSDSKPAATAKSTSAAPAKKTAVDSKADAKSVARPPAQKTKAAPAADKAGTTNASAPAKKAASKPAVKPAAKPSAKTAGAPRKNLPSSMAPPADAAPTPSTVPAAAPMPAPQSDSVEGRGDTAAA